MKLSELLTGIEYNANFKIEELEIGNVTTKIEMISEKTLFVIISGINFDTNKIINTVVKKRPAAVICDKDWNIDKSFPQVTVKNARLVLSFLCSRINNIDYSKTKFVGVTGTNGKTTTATMIEKILIHNGEKTGFIGTGAIRIGNKTLSDPMYSMTTPDPETLYPAIREMLDENCKNIVMEVSSHSLALYKVAPILFDHTIFTNLAEDHMDFHTSKEDYYQTKLSLFSQCKTGIFNADDHYSARAMRDSFDKCNTTSIGVIWEGEAMARDVIFNGFNGSSYIYREKGLLFKAELSMPGYHNIYNSLLALKCAISMGVKPCIAKEGLKKINGIDGRFETIIDRITVILDYAHTEAAVLNTLKTINSIKKSGQKTICVFGCGGERDKTKRPMIGAAVERYSDEIILTNDNPRNENELTIISDIISGMKLSKKRKTILSREEAIKCAINEARDGDIVIILGKGHERYIIDKLGCHNFDEKAIVKNALKKRNAKEIGNNENQA